MERRTKAKLERDGYYVMKSAGSKGVADLLAIKAGQILMIQCKLDSYVGPQAWNDLWNTAQRAGAVPVVVGRGQAVWRLVGPKDGSGSRQPWEPWTWDQAAAQSVRG